MSVLLLLLVAQGARWTPIGTTSTGNAVFVGSVRSAKPGTPITATVRVTYTTPIRFGTGEARSSVAIAMFDCAKRTVATKESRYYRDVASRDLLDRRVVKIPGFGSQPRGTFADVALNHLCR